MSFQLRTVDRSKLYVSIVDQIVDAIRSGDYPPGTALPSERVLAQQLGVSRTSAREAIRVLEHAGVLDVRIGSGTYVNQSSSLKAAMLRAHTAVLGEPSPVDVMVARRAIEPTAAAQAADNSRGHDLHLLHDTLRHQADVTDRDEDPRAADLAFHVAVAHTSQNPVLALVVQDLTDLMQEGAQELQYRTEQRPGVWQRYLKQHRAIFAAIERHDPTAAAAAMKSHLDSVNMELLEAIDDPPSSLPGATL